MATCDNWAGSAYAYLTPRRVIPAISLKPRTTP